MQTKICINKNFLITNKHEYFRQKYLEKQRTDNSKTLVKTYFPVISTNFIIP